eukprot:TRINITY_DN1250_c0_g1_i13.p1 TRINITY_DN1250_c0_g1~~TRINITY_DN1250_c0_g1_i13.p1  ORF type:complete len:165 (-),score=6.08 TRINITY_DN1250_c0_g1_i13:795-1289(-)
MEVHRISHKPLAISLKHRWAVWLFGLVWRPGAAPYQSFWSDLAGASHPCCSFCGTRHSGAIQSAIAFCVGSQLHAEYFRTWGIYSHHVKTWYRTASVEEKKIMAKLSIPKSLYRLLTGYLESRLAARAIGQFQRAALKAMDALLWKDTPPVSTRRSPWVESDWL